ncbi:uncharacterized protein EV154DRAFT_573588 [Mucor mucedo]|uniref:uncharacterized protein n=1 Tax=Mucor mucedo TaxID=29922 RepID=UPI00221EC3CB|nr:uncharacterized protein EV154DRAFT_573588 [Mucor mucedo]KAI7887677.1 hypothetical protein EV154DRAFT_573588 [Mucor mucedo]
MNMALSELKDETNVCMKNGLIISFIFSLSLSVKADVITPRLGSKCAYTFNKIYCYGGKLENKQYDNDLYSLNINSLSSGPVSDMISKWELVIANKSPDIPQDEYRYKSQFVLLPDGSMFFDGGYNEDNPLVAQNVTYNPQKNTWTVLPGPGFIDIDNGGYRQIHSATAVYIPNYNRIVFYGGMQLNAVPGYTYRAYAYVLPNLTFETTSEQHPTKKLVESIYGHTFIFNLNLDTREWVHPSTTILTIQDFLLLISDQTATYHSASKTIIYLGGIRRDVATHVIGMTQSPANNCITFNTESGAWKSQETFGIRKPTARFGHTATMLNTGDDILMYGVSADYLYTVNLITFNWTVYDNPSNSIGPRVFHSAVLVNDTTLFIMFGRKKSETADALVASNDIMVLNVTDMSLLTSLDTYPAPLIGDTVTNKTNTNGQADGRLDGQSDSQANSQSDADKHKGLSAGAITGIAVGSVAVIAIIVLAAIYRKKTRAKEEKTEEIQVDWDAIEGEYREDPPYGGNFFAGSANMTRTVVTPNVYEKSSQSYNAHPIALADSNIIKPDQKDLKTRL